MRNHVDATPSSGALEARKFFTLFNRLVDDGWLARLGESPLKVLLVFLRHADARGCAYPTPDSISTKCGINIRNTYKALAELLKLGLLQIVDPGGGRGRPAVRRVVIPTETLSHRDTLSTDKPCPTGTPFRPINPVSKRQETLSPRDAKPCLPATDEGHIKGTYKGTGEKASSIPIPGTLNNPTFRAAWADWEQHRRELKKKLTPLAAKRLLSKLEGWGVTRAIAAIAHSIERDWKGIFEPKANNGRGANGGGSGQSYGEIQRAKGDYFAPDEKPVPKPSTIDEVITLRVSELGETPEAARAFILSHGPAFDFCGQEDKRPPGFTAADVDKASKPLREELAAKRATV